MLHFCGRISFCVDVADFFQFQSPLKCDWELVSAPEVKRIVRACEFFGDVFNDAGIVQHFLNESGNVVESGHEAHELLILECAKSMSNVHGQNR